MPNTRSFDLLYTKKIGDIHSHQPKGRQPKGWPCGQVDLNKPQLLRSCMEIPTRLVYSLTPIVPAENAN